MTNLVARTHNATGNAAAALLLMRIAHWMPKATREFGGHLWITKAAKDWCAETAMSLDQYKSAVARLRRLRLVITEQHKFGEQTITHLRLTNAGRQVVGLQAAPGKPGGQP